VRPERVMTRRDDTSEGARDAFQSEKKAADFFENFREHLREKESKRGGGGGVILTRIRRTLEERRGIASCKPHYTPKIRKSSREEGARSS